jgi:hypothetical protein
MIACQKAENSPIRLRQIFCEHPGKSHKLPLTSIRTFREPISEMSQADAMRFPHGNALAADVIHQHLVDVFGPMAMAYSTVTRTIREMSWTTPEATQEILKGRQPHYSLDRSIRDLLNREPGSSLREIAQELQLPASMVFYVLTARMGYSYRKCHPVPHNLTGKQKQKEERFRQSCELLEVLQAATSSGGRSFSRGTSLGFSIRTRRADFGFLQILMLHKWHVKSSTSTPRRSRGLCSGIPRACM